MNDTNEFRVNLIKLKLNRAYHSTRQVNDRHGGKALKSFQGRYLCYNANSTLIIIGIWNVKINYANYTKVLPT